MLFATRACMGTRLQALTVLAIVWATTILAQERLLQPVVQGDLAPGAKHVYTVEAKAGDLISGTFELRGISGTLDIYSPSGSRIQALQLDQPEPTPVGILAPISGTYRFQVSATGTAAGSYSLRTERLSPATRVAGLGVTPTVRYSSPRLTQLEKELAAGQPGALDRFWSEPATRGGPLVEPMTNSDEDVLVTFLWKEIYETHNVLLVWPPARYGERDYYMSRLPGSNVWYKTVRVRRGSRFSYAISPNDRSGDREFTLQSDPLNSPRNAGGSSIFEMAGAPDLSWSQRTPAVRGTLTAHRFESAHLRGQNTSIYTPPGYAASRGPYPLLILFDGMTYLRGYNAQNSLDNLIADSRIRPPVVCFVSHTNRASDLALTPAFGDAIATELVPWLRAQYAISHDPKDVVIGGYSAGGSAAAYAAFRHPGVFGNVLSQSGNFAPRIDGWPAPNSLARMYADSDKVPIAFYLDVGLYEPVSGGLPLDELLLGEGNTTSNRHFHDVLRAKGYVVTYRETGGAHEGPHFRATFPEALMALLAPR